MKSKAEIIRSELAHLRVLDIGGAGFGENNAYERELARAWSSVAERVTVDMSDRADIRVDLNQRPLPKLGGNKRWDIVALFDVLEHLEHPVDVLRWVPGDRILVTLPNVVSPLVRRMESHGGMAHLYSFTPYTAARLLGQAGWTVERSGFMMGKWSFVVRVVNAVGSICPGWVATGIFFSARRAHTGQNATA